MRELIDRADGDLVVLARYMQIHSPALCQHLREHVIKRGLSSNRVSPA